MTARCVLAMIFVFAAAPCAVADDEPRRVAANHPERMQQGLRLFKSHVRSALIQNCLECHGKEAIKGDLDLSTRQSLLDSGVVGETAESSRLYALITHREQPHMPHGRDKLPEEVIARIARWINLGAPYDKPLLAPGERAHRRGMTITEADRNYWAFQPLADSSPPEIDDAGWCRTPIDRFVLGRLEEEGLHPNPPADRRTLIRRAYFDLVGLPPRPEEIERFVNDPDPHAYEKLIDRLLASPQYGERWARHWMDVARFAESFGYEQDYNREHAYHYRDFLIKALNRDMPYDRFVRWQLAGDELAPEDPLAMTATGFLGAGPFPTQLTEAEFESARYEEMDDMLQTTGAAFLGLTIGCARCHDHKFDPIPTRDYYRMLATFTTTIRSEIELKLDGEKTTAMVTSEGFPHMEHHADGRGYPHFYEKTYFLKRGDVRQKQDVVQQGFLQVLMRSGQETSHWQIEPPENWDRTSFRRASLANWITDPEFGAGHLAARVLVNRLWHYHFGRGIVATPNNFGTQGSPPTHPELLDWLAGELIRHGWRLKRLHRLIMNSAVYRQSSDFDEPRAAVDPENVMLWRWTPRRLEAEPIRDAMLQVSGLLDSRMYGPGSLDQSMRRRSVYFFIKRSELIPMMMLFDWPEHLVSIGRRSTTTTAPQALMFMNSSQARRYARGFAGRLEGQSRDAAVARAYRLALGRRPTDRERRLALDFLTQQAERYRSSGRSDADHLALVDFCQTLLSSNEFLYVD